jgi:hypothetical protein
MIDLFSDFTYKSYRQTDNISGHFFLAIWREWYEFDLPVRISPPQWLPFCLLLDLAKNEIVIRTGDTLIGLLNSSASGGDLRKLQLASLQASNEGTALVNIFSNTQQVSNSTGNIRFCYYTYLQHIYIINVFHCKNLYTV